VQGSWGDAGRSFLCRLTLILLLVSGSVSCDSAAPPPPVPRPTTGGSEPGSDAAIVTPVDDAGDGKPGRVGSCAERDLTLGWPVARERAVAWEVTHYFDLDPGPGTLDFTGAAGALAKTYDGHAGIDVSIAGFRAMDAGVEVIAIADGQVVDVVDGFFDRDKVMEQPACQMRQNYIAVLDPKSGYRHEYVHIRKGSTKVRIGDRVERGQALALVGSSGCSVGPHVHLNVIDCDGMPIDPFARGLFEDPPDYEAPLGLMDSVLSATPIVEIDDIADPGAQASAWVAGQPLGVGLLLGAGKAGDEVQLTVKRPDNSVFARLNSSLPTVPRLTYAFWNVTPDAAQGTWSFEALSDERTLVTRTLAVTRKAAPRQHVFLNVQASELSQHVSAEAQMSFSPRIVDGYNIGSEARFNLVFEAGVSRALRSELDAQAMQMAVTELAADGLHPIQVDAYASNQTLRFAAVFAKTTGIESYFDASASEHNTRFSAQSKAGRLPISIALVDDSKGSVHVAASYANSSGLTFQARFGVSADDLDARAAVELAARRFPSALHASDRADSTRYSAVWSSWDPGDYVLAHGLTEAELLTRHATAQASGRALAALSTTQTPEGARYTALWLGQSPFSY